MRISDWSSDVWSSDLLGFSPAMPVKPAGMRIEPPPSVPTANCPRPAATCAEAPPDEPPGVVSVFHGLRVMPVSGESVTPFQPISGEALGRAACRERGYQYE